MIDTLPKRYLKKIDFSGDCWLWTAYTNTGGYGKFRYGKISKLVHRFMWEKINGEIPNGLHVCHRCDVRHCVNPEHLFLGTNEDNMNDKIAKGRQAFNKGEAGGSKLKKEEVSDIRRLYQRGVRGDFSTVGLSRKYGVSQNQICNIVNNKSWVV